MDVEWTEAHQKALDDDPAVILMNALLAARARLAQAEARSAELEEIVKESRFYVADYLSPHKEGWIEEKNALLKRIDDAIKCT